MKKYDVIIVGCGPAGVAAAKILKDNNINFCMIEKEKMPREKLCGGGLTNKSVTLLNKLGFKYNEINLKEITEVELVSKNIDRNMKLYNKIVMIDRLEFDYNNLKQVIDNNLFEEEKVLELNNNLLITDKDEYEFKYIIFADGVNGYSRRLIDNRKFGFCVEYSSNKVADKTILDFCAIDKGYGWIFPKVDHTTIGLGNFNKERVDYKNLLLDFSKKYGFETDEIKGYFIPSFNKKIYKKSVIDDKYILVGDSASLVDPVSGEGIYYALYSGMMAAKSIVNCINNNKILKKEYLNKTKLIYRELKKRKSLSKLLYSKHKYFYIKLGLSNRFFIKYINTLFG